MLIKPDQDGDLSPSEFSVFFTSNLPDTLFSLTIYHMTQPIYILPLRQVGLSDIGIAGGKNASLGEMINNLDDLGIKIPDGFVITVYAYREFLESSGLESEIRRL